MLTQKKALTFNKENDNRWYLSCKEYEEEKARMFRATFTYINEEGRETKYETKQDFSNPMDDHTKHPAWPSFEPHQDLMMDESFELLLEGLAKGNRLVTLEVISYGFVSNTYTHVHRFAFDENGADYEFRFRHDLPQRFRLTPICRYLFDGGYPEHFHGRVIG